MPTIYNFQNILFLILSYTLLLWLLWRNWLQIMFSWKLFRSSNLCNFRSPNVGWFPLLLFYAGVVYRGGDSLSKQLFQPCATAFSFLSRPWKKMDSSNMKIIDVVCCVNNMVLLQRSGFMNFEKIQGKRNVFRWKTKNCWIFWELLHRWVNNRDSCSEGGSTLRVYWESIVGAEWASKLFWTQSHSHNIYNFWTTEVTPVQRTDDQEWAKTARNPRSIRRRVTSLHFSSFFYDVSADQQRHPDIIVLV